MRTIEAEIILDVDVSYEFCNGTKQYVDRRLEQYHPGDDSSLNKVTVTIKLPIKTVQNALEKALLEFNGKGSAFVQIDITEALSEREANSVLDQCYKDVQEGDH